jgi:2-polyprenyl-3-methyl-5-hydroxy-6-metoxy-1,4-benzoquinol methylase
VKGALKRFGRILLWPLRRFFDPRFGGLSEGIGQVIGSNVESTAVLGRSVAEVQATVEELMHVATEELRPMLAETLQLRALAAETRDLAERASGAYFERLASGAPDDLDAQIAHLLNYAESHRGFAAQRQLWFNPPLSLAYQPRGVELVEVNERIAEVPYAFRALGRLPPGARVLDVGAAESTVAFSLACLGYEVTAIDIRPYPLRHPGLRTVVAPVEEWAEESIFDAVLCLSTLEHIGLPAYGGKRKPGADVAAMRRLHELTAPGGLLVLTTRFGKPDEDEFQRTYDRAALESLLAGWNVDELIVVRRDNATTWLPAKDGLPDAEAVALVSATRSA